VVDGTTLPDGAVRLAADGDGDGVWVTGATDTLSLVTPEAGGLAVRTTTVGDGPIGVAVAPDGVWVADAGGGSVSRVDPNTGAVLGTYPVGTDPTALAAGGGLIWVADGSDDHVRALDPATGAVTRDAGALAGTPRQALATPTGVYLAVGSPGSLVRIAGSRTGGP
jgi:DNA-binding beta-propeller fold protein YncE